MNQENEALLNQGISAVRGGNKREGARILAQVVRVEPQSDEAWFWLAAATDQPGEAKACLDRVLKLNPNHTRARQALELINQSGGAMPPTSAFTGEGGYGAPPPRPLSTNELLSPSSGFDPYGAAPPPPSPYGSSSTNFPPPPPFGASAPPPPPFGATTESVPPPPFGTPSWAQSTPGGAVPPPPADPYGAPAGMMAGNVSIPNPPPITPSRPGLSFGQLDPAAAAAQASQAVADQQAGPQVYDPGAEIRRQLLGEPPAPPNVPPAQAGPAVVEPPKAPKPPKAPARNNRRLLLIVVAAAVIIMAVLAALSLTRNNNTTTVVSDVDQTSTAAAGLAVAATPTVATTTSAPTTAVLATSAAPATTQANAVATTAPVILTTAASATTAAPANPTPAASTATSQPATVPTVARPTTAAATTARPAQATPTRNPVGAVTIVPPSRPPTPNGPIPPAVQQYVNEANDLINQMAFIEGQINTLIVDRYKKGDFARGAPISKSYEISFFTLVMGQLAAQFRLLNPPAEAQDLHQIGLDYASDIRESAVSIDRFFDTGRISYLEDVSNFMSKAASDRAKWFQVIQTYPFKVN